MGPPGVREFAPVLSTLCARLAHRGPDDRHCLITEGSAADIGLCATRLAIRDTSALGRQPMVGSSGSAIAFNGELYNADELRSELATAGCHFLSGSDTEVALAALEVWGDEALHRFNGMFGLAFHDRACGRLLLARDPMGIKPLYYAPDGQTGLIFSSELRALLSVRAAQPQISRQGVVDFLAYGAASEPGTIIDGIRMLAPGNALAITAGSKQTLSQWWSVDDQFAVPDGSKRADAEQLRELLRTAVRRQLVSDVPIGLFLSGGVDSSALVGLAAEAGVTPRTVSIVFAEERWSEKPWIDAVVQRHATEHQEIRLSADDFRHALPAALAAMDQPTFDGVNTYVVSRAAHEAGLTVALSGLGGDELFAGYPLFRSAPRLDQMRRRLPRLPGALAMLAGQAAGGRGDRGRKLGRWLSGEPGSAYELQREVLDPQTCQALLGGTADPTHPVPSVASDSVNALSLLELKSYMRNVLLRDADVMSMAHGLEVRVPLLDVDVVMEVARLPGALKLTSGREKGLLVDAVRDLLPPAVVDRPKMGFTLPFESWMRGSLHTQVAGALLDADFGGGVAQFLDPLAVADVWKQFEQRRTSWTRPWALYVAKVWGEHSLTAAQATPRSEPAVSMTVRPRTP